MNKRSVKIGDKVFVIRKFGNYSTGYDIQILSYTVKYKGEHKFVPEGFNNLKEQYREIDYNDCYKSSEEAKKVLVNQFKDKDVSFTEHYNGSCIEVIFDDKKCV